VDFAETLPFAIQLGVFAGLFASLYRNFFSTYYTICQTHCQDFPPLKHYPAILDQSIAWQKKFLAKEFSSGVLHPFSSFPSCL